MEKNRKVLRKFFSYLEMLSLAIGTANVFSWIFFLFCLFLALGTDESKGDFGPGWIMFGLNHPVIMIIWTGLGAYWLVQFAIFMRRTEAGNHYSG